MAEVGIAIVTYNSEAEIGPCLDAALPTGAEIVVVDNASRDCTRAAVARRGVRLIANPINRGFAAAVNQAVRSLPQPLILLLNPDAVLETGLEALAACCSEPGVAGAGGRLEDADGKPQIGFMVRKFPTPLALCFEALLLNRLWPRNPVNWNYRCLGWDSTKAADVEQPAGAFLMIRRDIWDRLGGFDEEFRPLWFEDVDFCRRAAACGYRFRYTPGAVAKHTGGHSIPKIPAEMRQICWYGSLLRYARRHYRPFERRLVSVAVIAGSVLRIVTGSILGRSTEPIVAYGRVLGIAGRFLFTGRLGPAPPTL